ncbi:putative signal anchor [Cucumis melo var. makuwa]|uniref:Signal anchor n=1 Tax=Cucumis melo var. makuwa TaxID=1194695 RepID=A0A5A7T0I0_CUCMM|nr:putative signal anchor [Cucumis melo var. makuwa]TYK03593.1 putative signal anchor [Cucumis melo var. makuwa]
MPFGLLLGPDSPFVDEPCGRTPMEKFLGHWILTNVCLKKVNILASASSTTTRTAPLLPLSLRSYLEALAGDLGCFPLDDEVYPPSSHWQTLTPVILRSYLVFRVCLDLGVSMELESVFDLEPEARGYRVHTGYISLLTLSVLHDNDAIVEVEFLVPDKVP